MPEYLFSPQEPVSLPVAGGKRFAVRRIYCVGRNYAEHAREMGSDPDREPPFFFTKPRDAAVPGGRVAYPPATDNLHFEAELVLALHRGGAALTAEAGRALIYGAAIGVDLTRRDLQKAAKENGRPWDTAKGFDESAPIGEISPALPGPEAGISLSVNGETRQSARLGDMIWDPGEILSHLSHLFTLAPGDLVFTGTPAGVGPVVRGDRVRAAIDGLAPLAFELV